MLFNTLTVLSLAVVALAAPALERKEAIKVPARGVDWNPRRHLTPKRQNNVNSWNNFGQTINIETVIQQTTINVLQINANPLLEAEVQAETLLAQTLVKSLIGEQLQFNLALDNIRANTMNHLNSNVNTVIIIVTEITDMRDPTNMNTRYISRQLQSNPTITETAFVVIQETSTLSIFNNIPSSVLSAMQSSSSGASFTPQFGSYTPGGNAAMLGTGNSFNLYPAGSPFPTFANAQQLVDPATIVLPNQALFVQSSSDTNMFTSVVESELAQLFGGVSS